MGFAHSSSDDEKNSGGNTTTTAADLLRKAPHRRPKAASLPGGAGGASGAERGAESGRKSVDSSAGSTRSLGSPSGASMGGFSRSRPTSGGAPARPDSASRQSFRMIRQPSTYGDLHEMVAKQKLGNGVVRGLVGKPILIFRCFSCLLQPLCTYILVLEFVVLELIRGYYCRYTRAYEYSQQGISERHGLS